MPYSRRSFLKTTAVAVAGASLFDVRELLAPVRIPVSTSSADGQQPDAGVVRKRSRRCRRSRRESAELGVPGGIHGRPCPDRIPRGTLPAWHSYFWSWHRMYLYWFERIIRKMSGDANFALPYWNYESASERYLRPRSASAAARSTRRTRRGLERGDLLPLLERVATSGFMRWSVLQRAEQLRGNAARACTSPSALDGSVPTAAQDPIFYLHHSNIDRWWNLWLKQGGGRTIR